MSTRSRKTSIQFDDEDEDLALGGGGVPATEDDEGDDAGDARGFGGVGRGGNNEHEEEEEGGGGGFDANDYISAPPVDSETQCGVPLSEYRAAGTQLPLPLHEDFDWPRYHQQTQTEGLPATEYYLETLFRAFLAESKAHVPASHVELINFDMFAQAADSLTATREKLYK
jgi:hypothetical protein